MSNLKRFFAAIGCFFNPMRVIMQAMTLKTLLI